MSKIVVHNQPCLSPECGSHDARQIYDTGTSFCFSCTTFFPKQDNEIISKPVEKLVSKSSYTSPIKTISLEEIKSLPSNSIKERKISKHVMEFFDVKVSYGENGEIDAHYYPYENGSAYKVRRLPKQFTWTGKSTALFGQDKFNKGGKRLIITEGEIDALSVAQAAYEKYNKVYPVVAMSSATMTKSLLENRDWIRSFGEVVLCLDEDDAGRKATEEATKIIGFEKAKVAKLPYKDPNEVLVKNGFASLMDCVFSASAYIPAGIIGKDKLWEALQTYNSVTAVPYPDCLEGVNTKLKGMRPGEITLFISGTGSGKSTILRETMLHLLEVTPDKIGVVSLEESPAETARKLSGMIINKNPAKEELTPEELETGFKRVFGDDRVVLLDHQGSIDDNSIVDQLEYMCLMGCRYLFIDHITILVSEGVGNLSGNEAQDKVMNDLLRLVKRYPVWVGLVSHLRKAHGGSESFEEGRLPSIDDIRGSGSIKQISFDIISFARDLTADKEKVRNTIKMRILKARHTGLTGTVRGAYYTYDTGRLSAAATGDEDEEDEFTQI